ncbi:hypothetical protein V492_03756 [Pseudogymnoascus sp. VKM F-4246]|nr:hypothetical protein V492_03756 [Pseudogymnoascus sp. VKM F-4246]
MKTIPGCCTPETALIVVQVSSLVLQYGVYRPPVAGGEYSQRLQHPQLPQQPPKIAKQHTQPVYEHHKITEGILIDIKMVGFMPFSPWGSPFLDAGHTNTPLSSWHSSEQGLSPHMKGLDQTVYNPTADQLAETLKVIMMNNGSCNPVPAEYNSCILQVLEGYHENHLELQAKIKELEEVKKEKDETAEELWNKTLEWKEEESRYKTEIKKLEVILAKTPQGMELVTMARSQSVLRRNKKKEELAKKAKDKEEVNKPDGAYVPRRLRPGFNILLPDYAEKKDAKVTKSFMPRRGNSLSMGFGSVSPPRPYTIKVEEEPKIKGKRSMLRKLTHAGKKNARRLFHGGKSDDESPGKSPKKKKKEDTAPSTTMDQAGMDDAQPRPNAVPSSTRSLWGHFGRSSNANRAAKTGDAAQSAPAGLPKQKSPKKQKHKASPIEPEKSPKKPKHKASTVDLEKSPRKLKNKASATDFDKSPRKLKNKASAIGLETAAAAAMEAATRRRAWLMPEDNEINDEDDFIIR